MQPDLFRDGLVIRSGAPVGMRPRLSKQCQAIYERLQRGPASNDELSQMARKYTSRVSELREAGIEVECYQHDHKTGVTWYRLGA